MELCKWPECTAVPTKQKAFCAAHMSKVPGDLRRVLKATLPVSKTHRNAVDAAVRYARDKLIRDEMEAAARSAFLDAQGLLW